MTIINQIKWRAEQCSIKVLWWHINEKKFLFSTLLSPFDANTTIDTNLFDWNFSLRIAHDSLQHRNSNILFDSVATSSLCLFSQSVVRRERVQKEITTKQRVVSMLVLRCGHRTGSSRITCDVSEAHCGTTVKGGNRRPQRTWRMAINKWILWSVLWIFGLNSLAGRHSSTSIPANHGNNIPINNLS